jgi:hypothetical protein
MKPALLLAVLAGLAAPLAHAGPPAPPITYVLIDHSTSALIEPGAARDVLRERLPTELKRLYPVRKWGFVSEVEGGFDDAKLCIITARTMLLPRTTTGALVFKPEKTATTFGAKASATSAECKALAKAKLAESAEALRFGMIGR